MEVMAPASAHEKPKSVIHRLLTALSDELDIDIESLGSTTLRKEINAVGAEPDDCFYIRNAALVIGKDDLNLIRGVAYQPRLPVSHSSSSFGLHCTWTRAGRKKGCARLSRVGTRAIST